MEKLKYLLGTCLLLFAFTNFSIAQTDIEIVWQRVVDEILESDVDDKQVEELVNTITEDGTWAGINYEDVSRTAFEHSRHTSNMVLMTRAYRKQESECYKSKKVLNAIESALDYWVENDFICENWWHNQIGTPGKLVTVILLVGDKLPDELVEGAQPIIGRANLEASGARESGDRIKIASILAKNLLFNKNKERFEDIAELIEAEIKFTTGRGMQYDYSFHHRYDDVNNTLSYGLQYANVFAEWAAYVAGTQYAFSDDQLEHLIDYYLDGICKMMVFGKYPDLGAKNRSISRKGTLSSRGTEPLENLLKTSDYRNKELRKILKVRKGEAESSRSYSTFFWHSEYYSHQRPDWFASVRMFSSRNHNMEVPYNSEGLKNHHLGDGSNFIYTLGNEYFNIFPAFDWQKIPGATVMQKPELPSPDEIQKPGLTDFVGAVTNGHYGAAAFDFKSPHDPLEAKKTCFFFEDEYVCLGAGINGGSGRPVVTTLNQCLLNGDVTAMVGNQKSEITPGAHKFKDTKWVFHDGVGYMFPESTSVNLSNHTQTGSWYEISKQTDTPKEKVTKEVFKLWLEHGEHPQNESYQYIVVPATTVQELENSTTNRNIEVIANTPEKQAVKNSELGICQAAFYQADEIQITPEMKLMSDNPGMIMLKMNGDDIAEITVADPNRELRTVHFSVSSRIEKSGENFEAEWNEEEGVSEVAVELPQGVYAGESVTIEL